MAAAIAGMLSAVGWLATDVSAQSAAVQDAVPLPDAESVQQMTAPVYLHGPILDPFSAQTGNAAKSATTAKPSPEPVSSTVPSTATPANVAGFDVDRVPRMVSSADSLLGEPTDGVYALGTGSVILVPGGPILHPGDLIGSVRIMRIDGVGVYLANGTVLHQRAVSATPIRARDVAAGSPSPSPSPSAPVSAPATSKADTAPSAAPTPSIPPAAASAILRRTGVLPPLPTNAISGGTP